MKNRLLSTALAGFLMVCSLTGCASTPAATNPSPQPASPTSRQEAIDQVLASSQSPDPYLRANAIEAAENLPERLSQLVHLGLTDQHEAVRFTATAMAGRKRMKDLVPALAQLRNDPSPSVYAAALVALRQCGELVDISPLATLLERPDPTVRGNVALLLGQLGDPTAADMLRDIGTLPRGAVIEPVEYAIIKIQIAEALVRLGDETARNDIRAGVYHKDYDEVRIMATRMLGQLHDREFRKALVPLLRKDPLELRLAASESLARLRDYRGLRVALDAANHQLPNIRYQAAITLGQFNNAQAAQARAQLLHDTTEQVRIAAAAAVLQAESGNTVARSDTP